MAASKNSSTLRLNRMSARRPRLRDGFWEFCSGLKGGKTGAPRITEGPETKDRVGAEGEPKKMETLAERTWWRDWPLLLVTIGFNVWWDKQKAETFRRLGICRRFHANQVHFATAGLDGSVFSPRKLKIYSPRVYTLKTLHLLDFR